jgi:DNA-binding NarL/FixJ family response regulator
LSRAKILLVDDHEEFLGVERRLLEPEFEVVTAVDNGRTAVEQAERLEPDLVVLDISMPGMDGIAAARLLRKSGLRAKVVFLTVHGDPDYVREALAVGALGYVLKSRLASELIPALRDALAGRLFVSPSIGFERTGPREP